MALNSWEKKTPTGLDHTSDSVQATDPDDRVEAMEFKIIKLLRKLFSRPRRRSSVPTYAKVIRDHEQQPPLPPQKVIPSDERNPSLLQHSRGKTEERNDKTQNPVRDLPKDDHYAKLHFEPSGQYAPELFDPAEHIIYSEISHETGENNPVYENVDSLRSQHTKGSPLLPPRAPIPERTKFLIGELKNDQKNSEEVAHEAEAQEANNQNAKKSIARLMRIWKRILQRVF